ncbi:hypothetical protein [Paludisphaera rhizosphaerae]|uniref:hypothetical protein n=1 Tax=Paludisphaera rhizosphaerae TaxID=2711216 RepID=UPI0013EDA5EE|nr:hypothetical protein [Paludisphaera rhizosphaerae]
MNSTGSESSISTRRTALRVWSAAIVVGLAGLVSGCGADAGGGTPMVKDPEPLAPEETTEALLKSKAKTSRGRRR